MARKGLQVQPTQEVTRQVSAEMLGAFYSLNPVRSPNPLSANSCFICIDCKSADVYKLKLVEFEAVSSH